MRRVRNQAIACDGGTKVLHVVDRADVGVGVRELVDDDACRVGRAVVEDDQLIAFDKVVIHDRGDGLPERVLGVVSGDHIADRGTLLLDPPDKIVAVVDRPAQALEEAVDGLLHVRQLGVVVVVAGDDAAFADLVEPVAQVVDDRTEVLVTVEVDEVQRGVFELPDGLARGLA